MGVTISSEWMKNQVAGRVLAAQRALTSVYMQDQSAMIFSLDDNHLLTLTFPSKSSTTGWTQINLNAALTSLSGLGASPVVQSFGVSQDQDGSIWMVIAAANSLSSPSLLFISKKLTNSGDPSEWETLSSKLVKREIPDRLTVTDMDIGNGTSDGASPLVLIVAHKNGGMAEHYQINPNVLDSSWSYSSLILPQNATSCLDAKVGNLPGYGPGVYALCQLGSAYNMSFTTIPSYYNGHPVTDSIDLWIPPNFIPTTMATLQTANEQTELYLGGNGIYRYTLAQQQESNLLAQLIADDTYYSNVDLLLVVQDPDAHEIDIWATNDKNVLVHSSGSSVGDDLIWQQPVYVEPEVTTLSAFRSRDESGKAWISGLAFGKTDGSLSLSIQDSHSGLWRPQSIALEQKDTAVELSTFTTRIRVLDDDGIPLGTTPVDIQPSYDCAALINGQYYALRQSIAKTAITAEDGTITIVLETPDLAAPVYTVTVNQKAIREDPAVHIKNYLRSIQSKNDIAHAKRSNGKPLFPNGADDTKCDHTADALNQLMKAHDSLPAGGEVIQHQASGSRFMANSYTMVSSYGLRFTPQGTVALTSGETHQFMSALSARNVISSDGFLISAGDFFTTLLSGMEKVGQLFINQLGPVWEFIVDLGNRVLHMIFTAASQVMTAIDWVFKEILGISIEEMMDWLGYMFDWEDILMNHRAIHNVILLGMDKVVHDIQTAEQTVHQAFSTIREKLINDKLIVDQSNAIFSQRVRRNPESQETSPDQSPQGNWGIQQYRNHAANATFTAVTIEDLSDIFKNLTDSEIQIIQNAVSQIQSQIIEPFDNMSFGDVISKLLQIIGASIINTAENIAITFLECVELLVRVFKAILTSRWNIPVLTYMYEEVICQGDGSQLTLLDAICLLTAIPATLFSKAVAQRDLFAPGQAKAISQAGSWTQLMGVFSPPVTSHSSRSSSLAQEDAHPSIEVTDPRKEAETAFQCLAAFTRTLACEFYIVREAAAGEAKDTANEWKVVMDWCTYLFNIVSMSLKLSRTDPKTTSLVIDSTLTSAQLLVRIKDTYLVVYKRKHKTDSPLKKGLSYAESVFGIGIVIASCVSIGFEANETPPKDKSESVWKTEYSLKFIQNFMTGFYRSLAFVSSLPDLPPQLKAFKKASVVVRGGALVIRAGASLVRVGVKLKDESPEDNQLEGIEAVN